MWQLFCQDPSWEMLYFPSYIPILTTSEMHGGKTYWNDYILIVGVMIVFKMYLQLLSHSGSLTITIFSGCNNKRKPTFSLSQLKVANLGERIFYWQLLYKRELLIGKGVKIKIALKCSTDSCRLWPWQC